MIGEVFQYGVPVLADEGISDFLRKLAVVVECGGVIITGTITAGLIYLRQEIKTQERILGHPVAINLAFPATGANGETAVRARLKAWSQQPLVK